MLIEKKSGMLVISEIVKGYLITKRYMEYTKKEAVKKFKSEVK